jgi:phosphoenolpyruvate carboxykinase (ATP)
VFETFNFQVPTSVTGVPAEILNPRKSWKQGEANFKEEAAKLAKQFMENFKKYREETTDDVVNAGT